MTDGRRYGSIHLPAGDRPDPLVLERARERKASAVPGKLEDRAEGGDDRLAGVDVPKPRPRVPRRAREERSFIVERHAHHLGGMPAKHALEPPSFRAPEIDVRVLAAH